MLKPKLKTIKINTGVNPYFLENTLTEDISPLASLFDLIDNSIDAARDHLMQAPYETDEYGLPVSYSGYKIQIRIDSDSIRILDNCLGIDEDVLSKNTFFIAGPSNHSFGIGHYGLGLKRALLKFGSDYAISTDTGNSAFKVRCNKNSFGGASLTPINADKFSSTGSRKVLISVSKLKPEVKYEISSEQWFSLVLKELATRYAVFVSKGLSITVRSLIHHQSKIIGTSLPKLRVTGNFPPNRPAPLTYEGVQIYIESGIHQDYLFPSEKGHSLTKNRTLTKLFGLYFICNDRVIVANSLSPAHGWTATWHSEYNGFVCLVRFVSEDSSKMPWNTAKTEMRTDSTIFLKVKDQLQPTADFYRKDIKRRYPSKKSSGNSAATATKPTVGDNPTKVKTELESTSPASARAIDNSHLHVKNWTSLLPKNFSHSDDTVLNALIIEAIDLELGAAPYASAMLYRALMEAALKRFVFKTGNAQKVKDHFYSSAEGKKKNHSDIQMKAQGMSVPIMLPWLSDHLKFIDTENKARLVMATKKMREHLPFLNGIVHGINLTDARRITDLRNDTIALLEYLISPQIPV